MTTRSAVLSKLSHFGSILTIVIAARVPARRSYSGERRPRMLSGLPTTLLATHLHGNSENAADYRSRQAAKTEQVSGLCPLSELLC